MSCHEMATNRTKKALLLREALREKLLMNGKGIGIFDTAKGDGLATFNVTHSPNKSAKACFVGALESSVRI